MLYQLSYPGTDNRYWLTIENNSGIFTLTITGGETLAVMAANGNLLIC